MDFKEIKYAVQAQVATITLHRPDKLNALTQVMENELFGALQAANDCDDVRVIVLTGAGKGFCSGADISLLQSINSENFDVTDSEAIIKKYVPDRPIATSTTNPTIGTTRKDFQRCWSYFLAVEKPIIAAINGASVGLGFIIPLFCDIRFAAEEARFSTAFSKRGLIAEHGVSWMLPRLIGMSNALDLLYSARLIQAEEALRINLVSRVYPGNELIQETEIYAKDLAENVSPRSLRLMKREVYTAQFQSLSDAIDDANQDMLESFTSNDFKEGVAHFVEKRPARFTGN